MMDQSEIFAEFASIAAREFNIPLQTLGRIAQVSQECRAVTQWRIDRCKKLYLRYSPQLAAGFKRKILFGAIDYNPLFDSYKYCPYGMRTKIIPIEEMGFNDRGLAILDTIPNQVFDYPHIQYETSTRLAFTNALFLAHRPFHFALILLIGNASVYSRQYNESDYTYLEDNRETHGGYLIDLQLPTLYNPIPLSTGMDDRFLPAQSLRLFITQYYRINNGNIEAAFIPEFILQLFTHCIIQFRTFKYSPHIYTNNILKFNGRINDSIYKISFMGKPRRVENIIPNTEILELREIREDFIEEMDEEESDSIQDTTEDEKNSTED